MVYNDQDSTDLGIVSTLSGPFYYQKVAYVLDLSAIVLGTGQEMVQQHCMNVIHDYKDSDPVACRDGPLGTGR